jgi:hypothetical protein
MELLPLITLLGNVVIPPIFNLVKGWISGGKADTPEQTMSNLATTKPETLPQYVTALGDYLRAQVDFFNRDVAGKPSQWVIDLRACIRPLSVIISFLIFVASFFAPTDSYTKATCTSVIGNWIGTKIEVHP